MKLRTSYFNPTAFKKDVLRFAPAWAIYSIVLVMYLMICCISSSEYHRASNVADTIPGMAVVNLIYGLLNAQLLFGDLYNARLCNALHAMPMRRECWFLTHTAAGLTFSFVPNLAISLIALPLLGGGWSVALWWLLASCLQYLCFFGLATLSALCVGNRFAMGVVYGIINFLAALVYWFYSTLYEPLLYGVQADSNPFMAWCPVVRMVNNYNMVDVARYSGDIYPNYTIRAIYLGEGWGYLAICAAVGAALLGLALVLYRRRNLEAAGDFMSIRALEPVFLVLYTITLGAFFHLFSDIFFSVSSNYVFLALGLIVGFFTGRMLLMRTVRVFQPKAFLGFGILAAVLVLSLLLTFWDVLGVTRRIPKTGDVETVRLTDHFYTYNYNGYGMTLDTPQEVDGIRQLHQMILNGETQPTHTGDMVYNVSVALVYELKNGTTVSRYYNMAVDSPAGQALKTYYTSTEYILGLPAEQTGELLDTLDYLYIRTDDGDGQQDPNSQIAKGLVRALIADCEAGNMAQAYGYHGDEDSVSWVEVGFRLDSGVTRYVNLNIYPDAEHTIAYLRENGFPIYDENYVAEYK